VAFNAAYTKVPDPVLSRDIHGSQFPQREDKRSLFQKFTEFLHPGPDSADELLDSLADAQDNKIIDSESRSMLEGVIRMAGQCAADAMVPVNRMDILNIQVPLDEILDTVIETGHSRFPVYEGDTDNIIGILLAKDLLKLQRSYNLNLRTLLRPAVFVPETKGLNDLLREFRNTRNHLALVVDEFGRVAGFITIEDIIEEIVGEIEDEFDNDSAETDRIFALPDGSFRIDGDISITQFNEYFQVRLENRNGDNYFETVGGRIAHELGHVPRRGEKIDLVGLRITAMFMRGGVVKWFKIWQVPS
jgi:magnesium and cobalt transporter